MATRGVRNNNPCNIRHSKDRWQGMSERQTDKAFVQFDSRVMGYRATFVLLRNYIARGHNTVAKIIKRWAPSSDGNNTGAYIRFVAKTSGVDADRTLRFEDRKAMIEIVRSMAQMESGIIEEASVLADAYEIASRSEK